jgi:hypothetical protein
MTVWVKCSLFNHLLTGYPSTPFFFFNHKVFNIIGILFNHNCL